MAERNMGERIKLHCLGDSIEGARICMESGGESESLYGEFTTLCMESEPFCVWRVCHSVYAE